MKLYQRIAAAVGAVLLVGLAAFAVAVPSVAGDPLYAQAAPSLFGGTQRVTLGAASYAYYSGMTAEAPDGNVRAAVVAVERQRTDASGNVLYDVVLDSRYAVGYVYRDITPAAYAQVVAHEQQHGVRLLWPVLDGDLLDANVGAPLTDESGAPVLFTPSAGGAMRRVRVFYADWYAYRNGRQPTFLLGTDATGADVASGVAAALRVSGLCLACAAVVAVLAGRLYGVLFSRFTTRFGWAFDLGAVVLSIVFVALCMRYLPSRVGNTAALVCALSGTGWLWAAQRCRSRGSWRTALAAAVQATPLVLLLEIVFVALGLFDLEGFGTLLTGPAPIVPALFATLLLMGTAAAGVALQPTKKER